MYSDTIKQATGCDDAEAERIEEFMRDIIFRSTLDWQTREQLAEAARLAQQTLHFQQKD
jgi:molybdopterin/thiamine biosynthesis adenylyltransferase